MILKIAYCVSYFPHQTETYLLNQLKELLDQGHKVTIFSIGKFPNYPKHALVDEYNMFSFTHERPFIPKNKLWRLLKALVLFFTNLSNAYYLIKTLNFIKYGKYAANLQFFYDTIPYLKEQQFDIVHCHFGPNGIKALNFKEIGLLRGNLLTSFHGFDINEKDFLSWSNHYSRKGLYKELSRECHLFTVSSNFAKQVAIGLSIPSNKIEILPVGLDTTKFFRKKNVNVLLNKPKLLTVARLVPFKGLDYGIKAFSSLITKFPDLEYHIVGEGKERPVLEKMVEELKLKNHVFFHGAASQEQIYGFYQEASIFLLTSIDAPDGEIETQGLVIQEAQSMELPVVVTDSGGIPEGIINDKTGFVVPQKEVEDLKLKLEILLLDPDLRQKMGVEGRKFVVRNFDNKVLYHQLMALYHRILSPISKL